MCPESDEYALVWNSKRGRAVAAHRLAYERARGPIPSGLVLDHLCLNKRCVNPNHLEAVTPSENVRRGKTKEARVSTHLTPVNVPAPRERRRRRPDPLTEDGILILCRLAAEGIKTSVLARAFGIERATAYRLIRRDSWKIGPAITQQVG